MRSRPARVALVLALAAFSALAAEAPPPVLSSLGSLEGADSVDVSPDGSRAAAAFPPQGESDRSTIRIASSAGSSSIDVTGDVRAVMFDPAGAALYAVLHRVVRRRPVESTLLRLDVATLKTLQKVTLPTSAAAIDLSAGREALLVACGDEVRTFVLPALTSGPLYRLPGENLAIATIPGSARVLIGRSNEIAVIDLRSQQQRDGIPVLAKVPVPSTVDDLLAGPEGDDALARLADGRTFRLDLQSMTLDELDPTPYLVHARPAKPATIVAEAPPPPPPPPPAPTEGAKPQLPDLAPAAGAAAAGAAAATPKVAEPKAPAPAPSVAEQKAPAPAPPPPATDTPTVVEQKAPAPAPPPPATDTPTVVEQKAPAPVPPPPATDTPTVAEQKPEAPAPATPPAVVEQKAPAPAPPPPPPAMESKPTATPDATTGVLHGTVSGPAAAAVVAIVVFGPDSVLHEAARMAPDSSGAFAFVGLAPGHYRVVPDGGGGKALVSEPPFATVEVTPGSIVTVPELKIVRAL